MPPKKKFNREEIVDAAFGIAENKGFDAISARSVAKELKSSVAPIYANLDGIDDLVSAVVQKVLEIGVKNLQEQEGDSLYERIGRASLRFARDYPVFFRELTMKPNRFYERFEERHDHIILALGEDEVMRDLSFEQRRLLLLKMQVFQLGLSVMIANRLVPSWIKDEDFEDMLFEVGEELLEITNIKESQK